MRLSRILLSEFHHIQCLLHGSIKGTMKDLWCLNCPDPGAALHWRGAQHADLSTQRHRGQHHRPGEGGTPKRPGRNVRWADSCPPQLEKLLTYDNLIEWTDGMDVVDVQVGLPRFKLEQKFNMKSVLVRMGMVDAFDVAMSDFSGRSLFPSGILRWE